MNSLRPWGIRMKVQPRHATLVLSCFTRKTPWRSRLSVASISESSRPRQQWFRRLTVGLSYEQVAWQAEVQDLS